MGGEFRHGFYSGFSVGLSENAIYGFTKKNPQLGIAVAATVGGTATAIGGGKFANGATSGAFSYLFNWLSAARGGDSGYRSYSDEVTPLSEWYYHSDASESVLAEYPQELKEASAGTLQEWFKLKRLGKLAKITSTAGKGLAAYGNVLTVMDAFVLYEQPIEVTRTHYINYRERTVFMGVTFRGRMVSVKTGIERFISKRSIIIPKSRVTESPMVKPVKGGYITPGAPSET